MSEDEKIAAAVLNQIIEIRENIHAEINKENNILNTHDIDFFEKNQYVSGLLRALQIITPKEKEILC